jgi:hypothetical protein
MPTSFAMAVLEERGAPQMAETNSSVSIVVDVFVSADNCVPLAC